MEQLTISMAIFNSYVTNHPNFNRIFPKNPAIGFSPFMMTQAHAQIAGACHGTSNRSGYPEDSQTFFPDMSKVYQV